MKITSPHPFAERLLLFGGGGAGKTEAVLSIAEHLSVGTMHVIDTDYSMAYERAIATTHPDAADRVEVHACDPEWEPFSEALAKVVATADPMVDWLVVDPISPSWQWVQDWYLELVYEDDLAAHLIALKREHANDLKAYQAAVLDDMNWGTVKKEYEKRVWRQIQRWKGGMVLCAEAKMLGYHDNKDTETQQLYGPIGFKPVGEGRLSHVAATNLFLDHPRRGEWRMTTVKDRNRAEIDKEQVGEGFAVDYLVGVAGWQMVKGG